VLLLLATRHRDVLGTDRASESAASFRWTASQLAHVAPLLQFGGWVAGVDAVVRARYRTVRLAVGGLRRRYYVASSRGHSALLVRSPLRALFPRACGGPSRGERPPLVSRCSLPAPHVRGSECFIIAGCQRGLLDVARLCMHSGCRPRSAFSRLACWSIALAHVPYGLPPRRGRSDLPAKFHC